MADFDVIAAVSQTLEARLTAGLAGLGGNPAPTAQLHDLVPPLPAAPTLTVFLYDIVQDPTVRNRPPTVRVVGGQHIRVKQPLGLILHYMLTAWAGDRDTELQMLGRAMQVLYDDAIVDGTELLGGLAGSAVQLKLTMSPLYLEDRARIWFAIGQPYRLSLNYEVRVVDIDAPTEQFIGVVHQRDVEAGVRVAP